jgi:AraC-like DNA-binding protein
MVTVSNVSTHALLSLCSARDVDLEVDRSTLDGSLDATVMIDLWGRAADATGDDLLGLHVATRVRAGAYGALDRLLCASATVRSGLTATARHFRRANGDAELRLQPLRNAVAAQLVTTVTMEHRPRSSQYTLALVVGRLRAASTRMWNPTEVHFSGPPCHAAVELERFFGAPVRFRQAIDQIVLTPEVLDLPHRDQDPELCEMLETELTQSVSDGAGVLARCRESARAWLWQGEHGIAIVARDLDMSVRTLQRTLAVRGTSYRELIDELRCEQAATLLGADHVAADVAHALGYSEPSAFYRAFRRWTGTTPHDWRNRSLPKGRHAAT